jgi:ABC-2 type transport system ATP-binding protein
MIEINQVEKRFGKHSILRKVSFFVQPGEIYGLIGKNGAGKTTLMNIMAGLSSADSGYCRICGEEVYPGRENLKVGYLPDLPAFYEYLSTGEYLDFLLMNSDKNRRNELLRLVDLPSNIRISTMSRGMRQRLGIAAAIVNNPDVILLDEPTSALDPSGRAEVMEILNELKKEGKAIVLSTHILTDMEHICDKVGFLTDGVIKHSCNISELSDGCDFVRVAFKEKVNQEILRQMGLEYSLMDGNIYRFEIDQKDVLNSQKKIFNTFLRLNLEITSIRNESNSLDKIFQEVCCK